MDFVEIRRELADRYPQWIALIGMVDFRDSPAVAPVDNDGRAVYYNGRMMRYYTPEIQQFYIAQQLVHIQLAHAERGAGKDTRLWKRACDAVVNSMLRADGFSLPGDAVLLQDADSKSADELYEVLLAEKEREEDSDKAEDREQTTEPTEPGQNASEGTEAREREIEDPGLAAAVAGLREMLEPSMQLDFDWFPGDTIRDGILRHSFKPYPVAHAEILLDTSVSVDEKLLRAFVRGVKALLRDAVVRVGCFDTQFYGFQDIQSENDIQKLELRGSGGTDFHAAINAFSGDAENQIIFTDGYAEMPEQRCDAVWVVYGNATIHPRGGRVLYVRPTEEKEKHEIDFLIT